MMMIDDERERGMRDGDEREWRVMVMDDEKEREDERRERFLAFFVKKITFFILTQRLYLDTIYVF